MSLLHDYLLDRRGQFFLALLFDMLLDVEQWLETKVVFFHDATYDWTMAWSLATISV